MSPGDPLDPDAPRRASPASPARIAAVHAALIVASWLFATVLYAVVVVHTRQLAWLAIDTALIAGGGAVIYVHRGLLGFRSLGAHRGWKLLAILAFGTACALVVQLIVHDRNGIWLDESHYLKTVRAGEIIREGRLPFNLRWLVPFLAGRWNLLPVDDIDAVKSINFGAFAVTTSFLILLLVRLRVRLGLALAAPAFLLSSYFGIYGASNRLVLDAFNYAMYVVLFHLVIRRDHWKLFGAVLLLSACNAEKALYWVPVYLVVALVRWEPPARPAPPGAGLLERAGAQLRSPTVTHLLWCCAPTAIYIAAIRLYLAASTTEWNLCFENIDVMSLSALGAEITNPLVKGNTFQAMWLPFGPFTIYALLGFTRAPRWMQPIALLLLPIFVQNLIACDGDRMVAYTFVVYLPFGYLYLSRALGDLPRGLGRALFGLAVALTIFEHYAFAFALRVHTPIGGWILDNADEVKMVCSAIELVLVATLLFVHFTWFARRRDGADDAAIEGTFPGPSDPADPGHSPPPRMTRADADVSSVTRS